MLAILSRIRMNSRSMGQGRGTGKTVRQRFVGVVPRITLAPLLIATMTPRKFFTTNPISRKKTGSTAKEAAEGQREEAPRSSASADIDGH